jgi:hypothetical protein
VDNYAICIETFVRNHPKCLAKLLLVPKGLWFEIGDECDASLPNTSSCPKISVRYNAFVHVLALEFPQISVYPGQDRILTRPPRNDAGLTRRHP